MGESNLGKLLAPTGQRKLAQGCSVTSAVRTGLPWVNVPQNIPSPPRETRTAWESVRGVRTGESREAE
jgi:hypothetical protein